MSEKLILKEEFGVYKGHIVTDFRSFHEHHILDFADNFYGTNLYGQNRLCKQTNKKKCKIDSEIFFLSIDKLKKEISKVKCEKCIKGYNNILCLIEQEKKLTLEQKLFFAVSWMTVVNYSRILEKQTMNKKHLEVFKQFHSEKKSVTEMF